VEAQPVWNAETWERRAEEIVWPHRRSALPRSVGGTPSQQADRAFLRAVHVQLLAEISTKEERLRLLERRKQEVARLLARKEELLHHEKGGEEKSAPGMTPGLARVAIGPKLAVAAPATKSASAKLVRAELSAATTAAAATAAGATTAAGTTANKPPPELVEQEIKGIQDMLRAAIASRSASGARLAESLRNLTAEDFTIEEREVGLKSEVDDLRQLCAKLEARLNAHAQPPPADGKGQPSEHEESAASGSHRASAEGAASESDSEADLMGQLHHWMGKLRTLQKEHPQAVRSVVTPDPRTTLRTFICGWCLPELMILPFFARRVLIVL
jgi:hypothetical protein